MNCIMLTSWIIHDLQYLLFEYPPEDTRVKVEFTSSEDTSHICAIASLQTAYVRDPF